MIGNLEVVDGEALDASAVGFEVRADARGNRRGEVLLTIVTQQEGEAGVVGEVEGARPVRVVERAEGLAGAGLELKCREHRRAAAGDDLAIEPGEGAHQREVSDSRGDRGRQVLQGGDGCIQGAVA